MQKSRHRGRTIAVAASGGHIAAMAAADLRAPPRARLAAIALVVLLHLAAIAALVRAFTPELAADVAKAIVATFTVTVTTPPPPAAKPAAPDSAGRSGAAGRKATPREVSAPLPRIVLAKPPAPRATSTGSADTSGARAAGAGTGAGGQGDGTGAGGSGNGSGGGLGGPPVKLSGDINSARDYPAATRDQRLGNAVVIALTVGTDGKVRACRVSKPSPDPESDRITCKLATERFRFRPARDSGGNPVEAVFGWKQRWFRPSEGLASTPQ